MLGAEMTAPIPTAWSLLAWSVLNSDPAEAKRSAERLAQTVLDAADANAPKAEPYGGNRERALDEDDVRQAEEEPEDDECR